MTGMASHEFGCACEGHTDRAWNRPEHWTKTEVEYLESRFGRITDAAIAEHLDRSVVAIRLKAQKLGLHKRDVGWSARQVAQALGVDDGLVSKVWIRRGLLRSRRARFAFGLHRMHVLDERDVERFIREHGHWVDADRIPEDSPFRALAAANCWISLTELSRRTGHGKKYLLWFIVGGVLPAARRGPHWYVRADDAWKVPARDPDAVDDSAWRREQALDRRNARRKGLPAPRPGRSALSAVPEVAA